MKSKIKFELYKQCSQSCHLKTCPSGNLANMSPKESMCQLTRVNLSINKVTYNQQTNNEASEILIV